MDIADGQLLRPAEVVDLLGVSRSWLYDAAKTGRIPCVRLGGADGPVRFRARELEAWIERSRVSPGATPLPAEPRPGGERERVRREEDSQLRLLSDGPG